MIRQTRQIFILLFLFSIIFIVKTKAQQQHFIYIQADSSKQFTAVVNNQTYNSSSVGYVIIPRLQDGRYNINISFPDGSAAAQNFVCVVNKRDLGFELKNFGSKGWGLFNSQTLDVIMGGSAAAAAQQETPADNAKSAAKTNAFGEMLGDVVNDSTLNKPVAIKPVGTLPALDPQVNEPASNIQAITPETPVASTPTSSSGQSNIPADNVDANRENVQQQTSNATDGPAGIIKAGEESSNDGTKMTFVDFNNADSDTINIFIPAVADAQKPPASTAENNSSFQNNISINNNKDSSSAGANNPFYKNDQPAASMPVTANAAMTKTDCAKMASGDDLDKIKKKMLKETGASEMVVAAKKMLAGKCVTTTQVKTMGNLFSSDDARYNFYEAMYNFTFDYGNFPSLESQLIDAYYKKRFEALLR